MRLLFLMLCAVQVFAGTRYYVKNGGNNSSAGTSDGTAWATVAKVNSTVLVAGDTVSFKCGSVWTESLTLASSGSGTSGSRIVVNYYGTGAKPEITMLEDLSGAMSDGNWFQVSGNVYQFSGSVDFSWRLFLGGVEYGHANGDGGIDSRYRWFINGSTLRVYSPSGKPSSYYSSIKQNLGPNTVSFSGKDYITFRGIKFSAGYGTFGVTNSDYIILDSCYIGQYCDGVAVYLSSSAKNDHWVFTADTIDRMDTVRYTFDPCAQTGFSQYNGTGDGIQVKDGDDGTVQYCVFKDLRHGSINLDAENNGQSTSNWLIEHNEFTGRGDYNRPLDVHTYERQTVGTIFRYNYVHNMTVHGEVMEISGNDGQYYYNILDTLYNPSWVTGADRVLRVWGLLGDGTRWSRNNMIANNTSMHCGGSAIQYTEYDDNSGALDTLKVYNNLFYENGEESSTYTVSGWGTGQWNYGLEIFQYYTPTNFRLDFRNNYVYNTKVSDASIVKTSGGGGLNGTRLSVSTFNGSDDEWESIGGNLWSNPSIGTDHKISSSSTAINAGIDWSHTGTDYFGNAIVGLPDVGAHEYTATTDTLSDVVTGTSSSVGTSTATLNGTVNPHSTSTTARVLYGTTTTYSDSVNCGQNPVIGTGVQAVSSALSGLVSSTTYHYKFAGSNAAGYTRATADSTFTTSAVVTGKLPWKKP